MTQPSTTTTSTPSEGSFLKGALLAFLTLSFFTVAVGGLYARADVDTRAHVASSHAASR